MTGRDSSELLLPGESRFYLSPFAINSLTLVLRQMTANPPQAPDGLGRGWQQKSSTIARHDTDENRWTRIRVATAIGSDLQVSRIQLWNGMIAPWRKGRYDAIRSAHDTGLEIKVVEEPVADEEQSAGALPQVQKLCVVHLGEGDGAGAYQEAVLGQSLESAGIDASEAYDFIAGALQKYLGVSVPTEEVPQEQALVAVAAVV